MVTNEYICTPSMNNGWVKVPIKKGPVGGTGKSQQAVGYDKVFGKSSKLIPLSPLDKGREPGVVWICNRRYSGVPLEIANWHIPI